LSHLYEQHGDLVPDPDMEIRVYLDDDWPRAEALTYQDTYGYQEVYPEPDKVVPELKKDLNVFLASWLQNCINQGHDLGKQGKKPDPEPFNPDFSALPNVFSLEQKDAIDELIRSATQSPMNSSRTVAIMHEDDLDGVDQDPNLGRLEIRTKKKNELERKLVELATILRERHGYTLNVDISLDTLWHLKKANFLGDGLTAYWSTDPKPVVFKELAGIGVVQAPRIEEA